MLWVRKDMEAEQVVVHSSDVTAVLLRSPDQVVLVVSVYVPGNAAQALNRTVGLLRRTIDEVRKRQGTQTDILLAGDFNRHDQL